MTEHQTPDREKKIAEIREALEKATPGPWTKFENRIYGKAQPAVEPIICEFYEEETERDRNNAHLIANAPEWLRFLLDELEQTRKESNMLREELHKFQELAIKAANHHKAERDKLIEGLRPLMRDLVKMAVNPSNARAFPSYRKMRDILKEIGVTVE